VQVQQALSENGTACLSRQLVYAAVSSLGAALTVETLEVSGSGRVAQLMRCIYAVYIDIHVYIYVHIYAYLCIYTRLVTRRSAHGRNARGVGTGARRTANEVHICRIYRYTCIYICTHMRIYAYIHVSSLGAALTVETLEGSGSGRVAQLMRCIHAVYIDIHVYIYVHICVYMHIYTSRHSAQRSRSNRSRCRGRVASHRS